MKIIGKIFSFLLQFIVIVYAILLIVVMMNQNKYGYSTILGKTYVAINEKNISELTKFKKNDLLLINNDFYDDINEGDIVYYYSTLNNEYVIYPGTITSKEGSNRTAMYKIKEEPKLTITSDRLIGKEYKKYSNIGKVYEVLTSSLGFLLLVLLPILIIFICQVYNFIILLKENKEE